MAASPSTPAPAPKLKPYRPYIAVVRLIRITGAVVASVSLLALIAGVFMAIHITISNPDTEGWIKGLLILAPIIVFGILFLLGYSMYMTVDGTTLSYFVFLFSLMVGIAFFQFLPIQLPASMENSIQTNLPSVHFGPWCLSCGFRAHRVLRLLRHDRGLSSSSHGLRRSGAPGHPEVRTQSRSLR
jgi:hypothetical protein